MWRDSIDKMAPFPKLGARSFEPGNLAEGQSNQLSLAEDGWSETEERKNRKCINDKLNIEISARYAD